DPVLAEVRGRLVAIPNETQHRANVDGGAERRICLVDEVPCPPGHDPTASFRTRAPASFKRLLGRATLRCTTPNSTHSHHQRANEKADRSTKHRRGQRGQHGTSSTVLGCRPDEESEGKRQDGPREGCCDQNASSVQEWDG